MLRNNHKQQVVKVQLGEVGDGSTEQRWMEAS